MLNNRQRWNAAALGLVMLTASSGIAQRRPMDAAERDRAAMLGKLRRTALSLNIDGVPAREAIKSLAIALDLPIVGRWSDEGIGHGMYPLFPVHLELEQVSGELALEAIIEQCAMFEPCTWQLRDGFVEVGTKERLGAPRAAERRTYEVEDLLHEIPSFGGDLRRSSELFESHPYKSASLKLELGRSSPSEALLELLRGIFAFVEPGNWDVEEIEYIEYQRSNGRAGRIPATIAHVEQFRGQILMTAPDFIHRQVVGYRHVIDPPPLNDTICAARSAAASGDHCRITVHPRADALLSDAQLRQRHLRSLIETRIDIELDQVPARKAFAQVQDQVHVPFVVRYRDDMIDHGIDASMPITLSIADASVLDVLNALLKECERDGSECTWQLRSGFVEFGTKRRLDAPAARETRIYEIADLIMHIPAHPNDRLVREIGALDLVQVIVEETEPDRWDYGQPLDYAPPTDGLRLDREVIDGPDNATHPDADNPDRNVARGTSRIVSDVMPRRHVVSPMPASIRYWRDVMIIHAPDYIHRQVGGYSESNEARRLR